MNTRTSVRLLVLSPLHSQAGLILESGEVNVVHHICVLMGFGCDALCPYMVFETIAKMRNEGILEGEWDDDTVAKNFQKSVDYGMRKVGTVAWPLPGFTSWACV